MHRIGIKVFRLVVNVMPNLHIFYNMRKLPSRCMNFKSDSLLVLFVNVGVGLAPLSLPETTIIDNLVHSITQGLGLCLLIHRKFVKSFKQSTSGNPVTALFGIGLFIKQRSLL